MFRKPRRHLPITDGTILEVRRKYRPFYLMRVNSQDLWTSVYNLPRENP